MPSIFGESGVSGQKLLLSLAFDDIRFSCHRQQCKQSTLEEKLKLLVFCLVFFFSSCVTDFVVNAHRDFACNATMLWVSSHYQQIEDFSPCFSPQNMRYILVTLALLSDMRRCHEFAMVIFINWRPDCAAMSCNLILKVYPSIEPDVPIMLV